MADTPTVEQAWSAVMGDVQAVKKGDRNKQQGFNFRGIDAVMNAVGPVLRKHGVTILPVADDIQTSSYVTKQETTMHSAIVKVRFVVRGPGGDTMEGAAFGEAADAGDKAVSKAHSVAYRTFLLQGLTIPTDDPDPDAESHVRSPSSTRGAGGGVAVANFAEAANRLDGGQRAELRSLLIAEGLPQKSGEMDAGQAARALVLLNEMVAA